MILTNSVAVSVYSPGKDVHVDGSDNQTKSDDCGVHRCAKDMRWTRRTRRALYSERRIGRPPWCPFAAKKRQHCERTQFCVIYAQRIRLCRDGATAHVRRSVVARLVPA